jgi:hypothetical protein
MNSNFSLASRYPLKHLKDKKSQFFLEIRIVPWKISPSNYS